jgi:hypothetical protein
MKKNLFTILLILVFNIFYSQECKCPENNYAGTDTDTIYTFPKGEKIALCGYRNEDRTFSEFVLVDCNNKKIINSWGATKTCKIYLKKDVLYVEELITIPVKSKKYETISWSFFEMYFSSNNLKTKKHFNENFPKYNSKKIKEVLKEYENQKKVINDKTMFLINNLFICSVSGNKKAKKYFNNVLSEYKSLDGAFKEEYDELKNMLSKWESEH